MRAHFGLPSVVGELNEGKVPRLTYVLHIRILNLEQVIWNFELSFK